jgi:hypothetical protein
MPCALLLAALLAAEPNRGRLASMSVERLLACSGEAERCQASDWDLARELIRREGSEALVARFDRARAADRLRELAEARQSFPPLVVAAGGVYHAAAICTTKVVRRATRGVERTTFSLAAPGNWSGRQDLNLRPPGPEPVPHLNGIRSKPIRIDHLDADLQRKVP